VAVANFFQKNALAAHQVLGGVDAEMLQSLLGAEVVGVALDMAASSSWEGRRTALLATDILARFYPRMALIPLGKGQSPITFVSELEAHARVINPRIEIARTTPTRLLVVGSSALPDSVETVRYIGSHAWCLRLSKAGPVGSGGTGNPFGAGAAACVGAANIFRAVMKPYLPTARLDDRLDMSVLDWGNPFAGIPAPDLDVTEIDLEETLLGGLGAIGNATIWALARTPRLRGTLRLIDSEVIELSNLQRYLLTDQSSLSIAKVSIAASVLSPHRPRLEVTAHPRRWGAYLAERGNWAIPRVATAFDTPEDRVAAQGSLPRSLLNAWTQLGDLGVSRHPSFGELPCVACLYPPKVGGMSEAERVASELGFAPGNMQIRYLLSTGELVSETFVRQVAANLGITAPSELERLLSHGGQPLRKFHTETVCGGVMLELGVTPGERLAEVPMAFQSALAGIMLAAEILLDAARSESGAGYEGPTRTALDLLRPVPAYPHLWTGRSERCICADPVYLDVYRDKHASRTTAETP
jgi:molybdopterin/thiamine biosynthesis adenylyltransferase